MAASSVLDIVTQACDELGISRPTTVVGSGLPQVRQLLGHLNAAGTDLVSAHDWALLIATASVATVSGQAQYHLPTDFERLLPNTGWDRTNMWTIAGSVSPQRQQALDSSTAILPTTRKEYRLQVDWGSPEDSRFILNPTPDVDGETISFMYVFKTWVANSSIITFYTKIQADSDIPLFHSALLVKELKWRFRAAKGLDANALKVECDAFRDLMIARDINAGVVDMTGCSQADPGYFLTTDGNWDLT